MEEVEIEMESRECVNCGGRFRAMKGGKQKVCSSRCAETPATRKTGFGAIVQRGEKRGIENVRVSLTKTPKKEPQGMPLVGSFTEKKSSTKESVVANATSLTKKTTTAGEAKTEKNEGSTHLKSSAEIITEEEKDILLKNPPAAIGETQPELSEDSSKSLKAEGLSSMRLLKKSGNRLMRLMEECVKDSDLDRSSTGGAGIESHRIELAINCGNALAHTIQTQVNMFKAMSDYMKGDK